ncbi:MAG: hypothetical protein ACRD5W_17640 [Candidatus Acidiferrales bacterium]
MLPHDADPARFSMMRKLAMLAFALGVAVLAWASTGGAKHDKKKIITWGGNTPEWNRTLGLDAVRMGCSSAPEGCIAAAEMLRRTQRASKVFLAIRLDMTRTLSEAREYSRLSLSHPFLYEVGFDDFVSQCRKQKLATQALSLLLREVARELKAENPKLRLGITLYTDQLDSQRFPLARLDERFRRSVDFVHLYSHYRRRSESLPESARHAKRIFPEAEIVAGIYAYDRRDYLPCAQGKSAACSNQEEFELFEQSLREGMAMLQEGEASWLEFYPGAFGLEEKWGGWESPRSCRDGRRKECVQNTKQMRETVRQMMQQAGARASQ